MRFHHTLIALTLLVARPTCNAQPGESPAAQPATAHRPDAVSLEGWQAETFPLPPAFAPELPSGTESLLFAPGWRDPKAAGFWSYAFVMRINEPAPDGTRIDDLLEKYYYGLMSNFAAGKEKDIRGTPVRVDVVSTSPNRFEAQMHLIDAFATFEPIDVRVVVETFAETDARSIVCIRLSPQPKSHPIWRSLDAAIARIRSQDPAPQGQATDHAANPMANYERLVGGEWRLTAPGMTAQMFNTWHWGPGRHSVRVMTDGFGADGNPWRSIGVHYWHPGRKQIRLLGLSTFDRQVSEGTITFEPGGNGADGVFDLFHPRSRRKMGLRWDFLGPDKYHDILLEATGPEGLLKMNEWDHVRVLPPTPPRPLGVAGAEPSDFIKPLTSLLGTWDATINAPGADALHTTSTFEWVPLADGIYARALAQNKDEGGKPTHLFDAYLFHHAGTKTLRCLALSNTGGVYEGDVTVLAGEGGALQLDLTGFEGDQSALYAVRFDFEPEGTVRQRVWSVKGGGRTPIFDARHAKGTPAHE